MFQWLRPGSPPDTTSTDKLEWVKESCGVREAMGPDQPQQLTQTIVDNSVSRGVSTWRTVEMVGCLTAEARRMHGDPKAMDLYWDVSAEMNHRHFLCMLGAGFLSCMLSRHWFYSTRLDRCLIGKEMLLLQGYPEAMDYTQNTDDELHAIASLGMSVPSIGAIICLLLAVSTWGEETVPAETRAHVARDYNTCTPSMVIKNPVASNPPRSRELPGIAAAKAAKAANAAKATKAAKGPRNPVEPPPNKALRTTMPAVPCEDILLCLCPVTYQHAREARMHPGSAWPLDAAHILNSHDNVCDFGPAIDQQWVEDLWAIVQTMDPPVVVLGYQPFPLGKRPVVLGCPNEGAALTSGYVTEETALYTEETAALVKLFGQAVQPAWRNWVCTTVP